MGSPGFPLSPLECRRKETLPSPVVTPPPSAPCPFPQLWTHPSALAGSGVSHQGAARGPGWRRSRRRSSRLSCPQAINFSASFTPQPSSLERGGPPFSFLHSLHFSSTPDVPQARVTNKLLVAKCSGPFQALPHNL